MGIQISPFFKRWREREKRRDREVMVVVVAWSEELVLSVKSKLHMFEYFFLIYNLREKHLRRSWETSENGWI